MHTSIILDFHFFYHKIEVCRKSIHTWLFSFQKTYSDSNGQSNGRDVMRSDDLDRHYLFIPITNLRVLYEKWMKARGNADFNQPAGRQPNRKENQNQKMSKSSRDIISKLKHFFFMPGSQIHVEWSSINVYMYHYYKKTGFSFLFIIFSASLTCTAIFAIYQWHTSPRWSFFHFLPV